MMTIFKQQKNITNDKNILKIFFIKNLIFLFVAFLLLVSKVIWDYYNNLKIENLYIYIFVYIFLVIVAILVYIYYSFYWKNYSYTLGEENIILQKGYFEKTKIVVPYNIIQVVDIENGFIMRKYGYYHISIKLLKSFIDIKYVSKDDVDKIKEDILKNKNKYKIKY